MSAADIIKELPRLTEADRRHIGEVLREIANADRDVVLCNQSGRDSAQLLDRMEDNQARHSMQEKEDWGAGVIPRLARDIANNLPEVKGFSERNLKRMVQFAAEYPGLRPIGPTPLAQLPAKTLEGVFGSQAATQLAPPIIGPQAAALKRFNSISGFQFEPPHVGYYQSDLPERRWASGGAAAGLSTGCGANGRRITNPRYPDSESGPVGGTSRRKASALLARAWWLVVLLASFLALPGGGQAGAEEAWVTVHPTDNGEALVNPGMGWTLQFYSNLIENYGSKLEPSDTLDDWPGLAVIYLRVPWSFLEPKEGEFNWPLLDTPAQRWIAKGKKIALRVTCCESWWRYATPKWVQDAGAKGEDFEFGKGPKPGGPLWDPDYLDPVFLAKLDHFLAALALRYDGNPNVAFIDIGSFGMWGEGHTGFSSQLDAAQTLAVVQRHIDLHVKHFTHTLLCLNDDVAGPTKPGGHFPEMDYAIAHGVTMRDDSILVQPPPDSWYHAEMAQEFWPRWPVVLEHGSSWWASAMALPRSHCHCSFQTANGDTRLGESI